MATIQDGPWEIIPGVRFEHTSIHNTFWTTPQDADGNELPGFFDNNRTIYNEPLGSLFINYRPGNNVVFRGAIWQSYTRPAFVQLGGGSQISVSNGVTTITRGNPNLDPIRSTNVDLGAEWTTERGGYVSLTSYYKKLSDYIYDSGGGQANPNTSGAGTVLVKTPTNGGDGHVYGIEATWRQKFEDLPGFWNGLGFSVNATRQNSKVDLGREGFGNERLQAAPERMANAEVFYEKNGFSLNLSYHYTGSYLSTYDLLNQNSPWDDLWLRPIRRVDLHAGYLMPNGWQFDLQISNLTRQYQYWSHIGRNSLVNSDIVDAGMTTLLTVKYAF
jgi:TonB-dependent receptor